MKNCATLLDNIGFVEHSDFLQVHGKEKITLFGGEVLNLKRMQSEDMLNSKTIKNGLCILNPSLHILS